MDTTKKTEIENPKGKPLSVKELAAMTEHDPGTIYEWVATRGLPHYRAGRHGRITIYWEEFCRWWASEGR